ncbi:dihydrodipicolinate synthase family protein [Celerinatantimonas sp. YJH-8]|uniref:dihydrodipicolinate synthase family protein n=1 Tax=Celerinatantimonas sp. YJH-8 TaxID=3228714 RepID=UPI0038BF709C
MQQPISGVNAAIITPMNAQGEVDYEQLKVQVDRQKKCGNNIFCGGTNGEFFALTTEERIKVAQTCYEQAAGTINVTAHIGAVSLAETLKLGHAMEKLGLKAVSVITPWFAKLRDQDLISYFTQVADTINLPIYLYNIPARTGNTITPEVAHKLADHPNIFGIKDSAGSYDSLHAFHLVSQQHDNFGVLTGPDSLILKGFQEGSCGCISGIANIIPELVQKVYHHFNDQQTDQAEAVQAQVTALRTNLYGMAFAPAVVKESVKVLGYAVGNSRYPVIFNDAERAQMRQILTEAQVL